MIIPFPQKQREAQLQSRTEINFQSIYSTYFKFIVSIFYLISSHCVVRKGSSGVIKRLQLLAHWKKFWMAVFVQIHLVLIGITAHVIFDNNM